MSPTPKPGPEQEEIDVVNSTIDAAIVRSLVRDWRDKSSENTMALLSMMTGVDFDVLLALVNEAPLIDKASAAKILLKMGEPLRPDMKRALTESRRRQP